MEEESQKLPIKGRVYECPVCGYTDGFHVSFDAIVERIKIILICPECHARFDPSWDIERTAEQRI